MIRAERTAIDQFLLAERPLRWDVILQQLSLINPPVHLDTLPNNTLSVLRRGIESDGATLHDLQQLSSIYPMEFAFSILLCTLRFPGTYSMELMDTIVVAIKHFKSYIMVGKPSEIASSHIFWLVSISISREVMPESFISIMEGLKKHSDEGPNGIYQCIKRSDARIIHIHNGGTEKAF